MNYHALGIVALGRGLRRYFASIMQVYMIAMWYYLTDQRLNTNDISVVDQFSEHYCMPIAGFVQLSCVASGGVKYVVVCSDPYSIF